MFLIENMENQTRRKGVIKHLLTKCRAKMGIKKKIVDSLCLDKLGFDRRKTMMVGIDVIHPSDMLRNQNDLSKCSLAGVVGSIDADFYHFVPQARIQNFDRCETVIEIGVMFEKLLEKYKEKNKSYPESYIIFRDGVSKAQMLEAVHKIELTRIKQTIFNVTKTKNYKITLFVVPKTHSTRFMQPSNPKINIPAGSGVFETIVEPNMKMFYLNAHFSPLVRE